MKVATAFSRETPVAGFEDEYTVCSNGNIFSNPRNGTIKQKKILKPSKSKTGYLRVVLSKNNKKTYKSVHRIVAESFKIGNTNLTVNHIDGNKLNNNVENLELITTQENTKHAIETGLAKKIGADNPNFKKWYAVKPCGEIFQCKNTTLKDFCIKNKIHISTIIRNMKNDTPISSRSKSLVGWRFYHA